MLNLLAAVQAANPRTDEPAIIKLLRRLHAAGDAEGCQAIRDTLHAVRRAALLRYEDAVERWKEAAREMATAEAGIEAPKALAFLADAIVK